MTIAFFLFCASAAGPNLGKLIQQYMRGMTSPPSLWDALAFPGGDPSNASDFHGDFLQGQGEKCSAEYKNNLIQVKLLGEGRGRRGGRVNLVPIVIVVHMLHVCCWY